MKNERRGETLHEVLMVYVAPVVSGAIATLILSTTTTLPKWSCFVLGLPIGTILGWIGMIGIGMLWTVIVSKLRTAKRKGTEE